MLVHSGFKMRSIVFVIFILSQFPANTKAVVELTNLKCLSIDKPFADFDYCHIKAINRTYKYFSIVVKLYKIPITNVSVTVAMTKKANGYKPFLYNITFDACKFLRQRKNPLIKYFFSFVGPYSNVDHPCPFDHDLRFEKINIRFLNDQMTKLLPLPEGEYGVFTTWWAYNIPRAHVNVFVKLSKV